MSTDRFTFPSDTASVRSAQSWTGPGSVALAVPYMDTQPIDSAAVESTKSTALPTETCPERNIPGSVVDERIQHGTANQLEDRTIYYDAKNNVTVVVTMTKGKIMSAHKGLAGK